MFFERFENMNSFYTNKVIAKIGFKSIGKNVMISRKASFYDVNKITIGNNVRIDDFCILSGRITIKNYVHISAYNALYGKFGIEIGNFSGISPRCTILSATDDFSGNHMIGPLISENLTSIDGGLIKILDFVQIGTNSIIMPKTIIGQGSVIGAFSFVNKSIQPWKICYGIPVKEIKNRSKTVLKLSKKVK